MKKVCHMTSGHNSNDTRIFYKECVSLVSLGFDVYLIAGGKDKFDCGVHIIGIQSDNCGRLKRIINKTRKVYKKAIDINADIYHIHDPELMFYALKLKRKNKVVIFDVHENYLKMISKKNWIPKLLQGTVQKIYNYFEKRILSKLDAIITVSPNITASYKKINPETYTITNYPIILKKKRIVKTRKSNVICFAGGITEQWCQEEIIKALGIKRNYRYKLIGNCSEEYLNKLKALEGFRYVDYLGVLSHDQTINELEESDIAVALLEYSMNTENKQGTLGNTKLFEAMSVGLPVICTNFLYWEKIIEKYNCGLCIQPHNVESIVNALNYFDNYKQSELMGKNALIAVQNDLNWETQESILKKIYEKFEK